MRYAFTRFCGSAYSPLSSWIFEMMMPASPTSVHSPSSSPSFIATSPSDARPRRFDADSAPSSRSRFFSFPFPFFVIVAQQKLAGSLSVALPVTPFAD